MTLVPFEPIGEKSRRVQVIEIASSMNHDDVLTYEVLESLLNVDRRTAQSAVNQALRGLEIDHNKTLEVVRNVGYRVVRPNEHTRLAMKHQRKSLRQVSKAKSKVDHVDLSTMTDGERAAVTIAAAALASQMDFARRADLRYASKSKVDQFVREQSSVNAQTAEEVESMKDRVARLEARIASNKEGS